MPEICRVNFREARGCILAEFGQNGRLWKCRNFADDGDEIHKFTPEVRMMNL